MDDTDKGRDKGFDELEALFAQARKENTQLPDAVSLRIQADADHVQAGFATSEPVPADKPGMWAQFVLALGGWPALGGLATACAAGVWIGFAPPSFVPDMAQLVIEDSQDIDLIGFDNLAAALAEEG